MNKKTKKWKFYNSMNRKHRIEKIKWKNFGKGFLSGVMTGIAFSWDKAWWLVFFSLIPFCGLIFTEERLSRSIFGFAIGNYMVSVSWLYALLPVFPEKSSGILLLFLAVFLISVLLAILLEIAFFPFPFLRRKTSIDILNAAFLYMLAEWFQDKIAILPFPWVRLAVTVTPWKAFIQSACVGGSLFISFLVVLVNGVFAWELQKWRRKEKNKSYLEYGKWLAVILIIGNLLFGYIRLWKNADFDIERTENEKVLLIQGNHGGIEKWNITTEEIFEDYFTLSIQGLEKEEDIKLVLWPETAIPMVLKEESREVEAIKQVCQKYQVEFLIGAIDEAQGKRYNALFGIGEKGLFKEIYTKQTLVPFGEYVPYEWLLEKIIPSWVEEWKKELALEPGKEAEVIPTKIGVAGGIICYESIFSDTARNAVEKGAEFFTLISNDSWFGTSAALRQHHAQAILRAVEQKRDVVRVSNTGISSFISRYGIVKETIPILERTWLAGEIEKEQEKTIYFKIGDIIAVIGIVIWGLGIRNKILTKIKI